MSGSAHLTIVILAIFRAKKTEFEKYKKKWSKLKIEDTGYVVHNFNLILELTGSLYMY